MTDKSRDRDNSQATDGAGGDLSGVHADTTGLGPGLGGGAASDMAAGGNGHDPNAGLSTPETQKAMRKEALYFASKGMLVFPSPPGTKKSFKSAKYSNGRPWGKTDKATEIELDWDTWPNANVCIAMGPDSGYFVLEVDTPAGHDVDGFASLRDLEARYGPLPETRMAISPSGSRHYYFKWPTTGTIRNSVSELGPGIDIRGEGGMVVAPPSLKPGVGAYRWGNTHAVVDAPQWLLDLVVDTTRNAERTPSGDAQASVGLVAAALNVIPNDKNDWEHWNKVGMAIWVATGGHDLGFEVFDGWSQKNAIKYNQGNTRNKWDLFTDSTLIRGEITAGSIFYWASEVDPDWRTKYEATHKIYPQIVQLAVKLWGEPTPATWREFTFDNGTKNVSPLRGTWFDFETNTGGDTRALMKLVEAATRKSENPGGTDSESTGKPKWVPLSFRFSELTATPWVARHFALRGAVTHIAGIGGAGKTGFTLQAAIAFTQGEDFCGFHPMRPLKVAFVSGEEPLPELRRRIAAIVLDRVGQKQTDCDAFMAKLDGKLFTYEGKNIQIVAKKVDDEDGAFIIRTPFHKELIANVKANEIDLVILDPIARLHSGLDENSAEMQELHNAADDLAIECNCGSVLVHHIKKASKGSVDDQHASRGHSSMTDAARITIMMANMSKDEAKLLLPAEDQPHYFRYCKLGDPKQNYGINSAEKWFYKSSVTLPVLLEDGSPDSRMVLKRWTPDPSADVLDAPWLQEFLDQIHNGINGEFYRPSTRGPREYRADALLEDRFNVHKQRSQQVLTQLEDAGLLGKDTRQSLSSRRPVLIYVVLSRVPPEQEDIAF